MYELVSILKKADLKQKIADVSNKISRDYQDRQLILIGVLKGAFIFLADLVRQLTIERVQIDFISVASYGTKMESSGAIRLAKDIDIDIKGRDVLLVEDIVDTGITLSFLKDHLNKFEPKSVKICTLIDKRERRKKTIKVDYVCHVIEKDKGFIVGYGLDYAENYRNLPELYDLKYD
jgi:hypoxanthine phosphoribosyltransferase